MNCKIISRIKVTALTLTLFILSSFDANAQITWPEGQLLPSFPAPAATQDLILLNGGISGEELYLFSSLKGLINRTQPRIFSYEGDNLAEGPYTWPQSLGIKYSEQNRWNVLAKYKSEVSGLVVYDADQIHTVNLAIRIARDSNALIASPALLERLTAPPYNFPVLYDLRGQFASKQAIYQYLFDTYWPSTDKRLLIGLSPDYHKSSLREYAIALGAAVIWLDPKVYSESALLNKFLETMPKGANYMGWWPEEQPGVERVSYYGITTIASDYGVNLTFHSGFPRAINPRPMPAKPPLENKIYVAFIISDGDNLQYIEHSMRKLWSSSDRGKVPIGWTISPAMVDAMPGALNYYHQSSTDNDNLISGPSGYGYTYPNYWLHSGSHVGAADLADYIAKTEEYNVQAGIRVITVWNTITNGIDPAVGDRFAANSPTLLGVTAQNTGGTLSIYGSSRDPDVNRLPGKPLSCNYCTGEQAMIDHIDRYSEGWSGTSPRFLIIQGNPWNSEINPTGFKNMQTRYSSGEYEGKYVFVRPDHIFQLIREANGLTINPGAAEGDGGGLTGAYFNGTDFDTEITARIDTCVNFDWDKEPPLEDAAAGNFSIRWTGQIMPLYSGTCTFYLTCDDNGRLWINDELIINKWSERPGTHTGAIALNAGEKYNLKLEYKDARSPAECKLEWASPFHSREVVPKSQLFKDILITTVKNIGAALDVKAYPSRFGKGIVNIELANHNGNEDLLLTVYDIYGKTILKQAGRSAQQQLNLSRCSKGIYLISVHTKNDSKTVRYLLD
jgi:hypothetical protein